MTPIEIATTYRMKGRRGTAAEWTAENETLLEGERGFETDTGYFKDGDGSTAWNDLDYSRTWEYPAMTTKSADFVIGDTGADVFEVTTGATNRTGTLPTLADNYGRILEIHKVDAGAGKVTADGEGAETVDGVASIDLDSQYDYCKVRGGTTCWHVLEYKDHGSNANGKWTRRADGTMEQWDDECDLTGIAAGAGNDDWTLPQSFANTDYTYGCLGEDSDQNRIIAPWPSSAKGVASCRFRGNGAVTADCSVWAIGPWRT